ncbi:glyoxalase [Sphaerisporangium siamense]|uniref:Glyoxylase I family protein n=1 Tax=Sphaerisporangium siamense TaxID=795645 RepID=A0A7W7D7J8_9ACTN|nr:VOC family protein [Sphaerisporangium siamense]MBB4700323.1 glyoxylase I family protein [Sphaerisporangium siamense]GII87739.1 glyoxalase [Sphaerisporangium siamense]
MPDSPRWSHVGLNCRDQKATEEFYTRYFGFRRARVAEADGTRVIFLRRGDALLELFPTTAAPAPEASDDGPATPGVTRHLAFQVDDVDAFLDQAGDDAHITLGPLKFDEYIPGWKTVWVRDPDGLIIEISQGYVDQPPEELQRHA